MIRVHPRPVFNLDDSFVTLAEPIFIWR